VPRAEDNLARRGFLAVACPDGLSDQYPKGTRAIRDHEHCMFAGDPAATGRRRNRETRWKEIQDQSRLGVLQPQLRG
jgi:hypothetical protein